MSEVQEKIAVLELFLRSRTAIKVQKWSIIVLTSKFEVNIMQFLNCS